MEAVETNPEALRDDDSEVSLQKRRSTAITQLRRHLAEQSDLLALYGRADQESRQTMERVEEDIRETLGELDRLHESLHQIRRRTGGGGMRSHVLESKIPVHLRNSPEYLELVLLRHCASDHADVAHYEQSQVLAMLESLFDRDLLRRTWAVTPSSNGGFDGRPSVNRTAPGTERLHELEHELTR